MQSGISASAELRTAFSELLTNTSHRGLLATINIKSERIEPLAHIPSSSASFLSDLAHLTAHVNSTTPLYILLRRADDLTAAAAATECVAVTYVPNAAPVRAKTLFAATRLTLVRELGGEHFPASVFLTEPDELTAEGWRRQEKHEDASQPLTREELEMEGIKEAEARERGGTGPRRMHVESGFAVKVGDGVVEALEGLKGEGGGLVQLKFDVPTETLILDSTTSHSTPSTLSTAISASEPRYSFYAHPSAAADASNILFIYTCPTASRIKDRMLYASSRQSVLNVAAQAGLLVARRIEATDPQDVTADAVDDEFKSRDEVQAAAAASQAASGRGGFARPKRPGKR